MNPLSKIGLFALTLPASFAGAQITSNGDPDAATKPTLTRQTTVDAIRLSIANGVIDFVNDARRARVHLAWDYLPADASFVRSLREGVMDASAPGAKSATRPFVFSVANRDLFAGTWLTKLSPGARAVLKDASLGVDPSDLALADATFAQYWTQPGGVGYETVFGAVPAVGGRDYYALARDFRLVTGLLRTRGIRYSLTVSGAQVRGANPIVSDPTRDDIVWRIEAYPFLVRSGPAPVRFYRFVIHADLGSVDLFFPNAAETQANLAAGVSFVGGTDVGLLQRDFSAGTVEVALSPAVDERLQQIATQRAESEISADLRLFGGADLDQIVTSGLLGGTTSASVVTGGMFGPGGVASFVGVNQELRYRNDASLGVLIGLRPGGGDNLFVGPSLRYSVVTLAAGLRAYGDDDRTRYRLGGVLSFDLSRLTGAKRQVTKLQLDNASVGGDIGVASDLIAQDLSLVRWSLASPDPGLGFSLTQTKDRNGNAVSDAANAARYVVRPTGGAKKVLLLPAGTYAYGDIPAGYTLRTSALASVQNGATVIVSSVGAIQVDWTLVHG